MTTRTSLGKRGFLLACLSLATLIVYAPSCGGRRGVLTGKVYYEGETLSSGSVLLVGPDSRPMTAAIKEDGSYKFINVPLGEAKLAVYGPQRNRRLMFMLQNAIGEGFQIQGAEGKGMKIVIGPGGDSRKKVDIPASYKDLDLSGLRTTIRGGANTYDIEMKQIETEEDSEMK